MDRLNPNPDFWTGKRVLLTGHTGFKGAWTAVWLNALGARVSGLALPADGAPNLLALAGEGLVEQEALVDIRDASATADFVRQADPDLVLHMGAQALVRLSYEDPVGTFSTNVMGTVHVLDALRGLDRLEAALFVTTDKVYRNNEDGRDFIESDPLGGHDPYSASKAGSELAVASYAASFLGDRPIATARAGNVIGGGDWSADRLVPDIVRAAASGVEIKLRYPAATRPWQHVLEPLSGYLLYLERLASDGAAVPKALNFGPRVGEGASVAAVAEAMGSAMGLVQPWAHDEAPALPEMELLSLDPGLARRSLGWSQRLSCQEAIEWSASWYRDQQEGGDARTLCLTQIDDYMALAPRDQE